MAKAAKSRVKKAAAKKVPPKKAAPKQAPAKKAPPKQASAKKAAGKAFRMPVTDPRTQAALDDVLSTNPELRAGKMFGCPGWFLGKKAVACVFGPDVCLTLPPAEIETLVSTPGFRKFQPMGRTMSGWVLVNREQIASPSAGPLLQQAIEYARAKADAQTRK